MAYQLTSAADFDDLLTAIASFASAQGWTIDWNTGSQIGLHSGNCYAAWGLDGTTNPVAVTDTYPEPDVVYQDFRIRGSLGKDFVGAASHYWGLTGSPVTAAADADAIRQNDLGFPMSEVHLFGTDRYIWVMCRVAEDRYTWFGFGLFDQKGQTVPDSAFMCGQFWHWWNNGTAVGGYAMKITMDYHAVDPGNDMPFDNKGQNNMFYIPDNVVDPSTGIVDDAIYANTNNTITLIDWDSNGISVTGVAPASPIDHFPLVANKPVTGGVPLMSVPFFLSDNTTDSNLVYIGDYPGVRYCNISNIGIGEELDYGSEIWLPFPIKRRMVAYDGLAGSWGFGVAFRKDE